MSATAPYPLNPNLSCVERVRTVFREIIKRRLVSSARIRPGEFNAINEWVIDVQYNTLPIALINEQVLKAEWAKIENNPPVREFLFGLCFEMRQRCFEEKEDFDAYINTIAQSITQFNDQLSAIPVERLNTIGDEKNVQTHLAGNTWVLPIILLEQMEGAEIGIEIAMAAMETALERSTTE